MTLVDLLGLEYRDNELVLEDLKDVECIKVINNLLYKIIRFSMYF